MADTTHLSDQVLARTVARLARQVAKSLDTLDMSVTQYQVLVSLGDGITSISRLAERLSVMAPTMSVVVDGLVQKQLISRQQSAKDRRYVELSLTEAGRDLLTTADEALATHLLAIAHELQSPTEADRAVKGLKLWHKALDSRVARRHDLPLPPSAPDVQS